MAQGSLSHDSPDGRSTESAYPPQSSSIAFPDDPFSETYKRSQAQQLHTQPQPGGMNTDSITDWAKATRFTVLNHFSHVTNVARNGAHNLLSSPLFQQQLGDSGDENGGKRSSTASLATSLLQHGPIGPFGPNDPSWKHSDLAQKSGTGDFDSAHVYLARWAKIVAEEGETNRRREAEARRAIHKQSIDDVEESELGQFEVWNRLPHIDRPEATRSRDNAISLQAWKSLFDKDGKPVITRREMKVLVFQQGFGKGKERAMGTHWDQLDPRAECWSFLLKAQPWDPSIGQEERRKLWNERSEEYWAIKTQYLTSMQSSPQPAKEVEKEEELSQEEAEEQQKRAEETTFWKEQRHRVHVDCLRVDRKIPFFNDYDNEAYGKGGGEDGDAYENINANAHAQRLEEILLAYVAWDRAQEAKADGNDNEDERGQLGGYVQGMSDLCAPLYAVCHGDEAKTFWLLVGLMKRARSNFYSNQSGMKMQLLNLQKLISIMDANLYGHLEEIDGLNLFFCFRWLLVLFKREFEYPEILILWEGIWAAEVDEQDGKNADDHMPPTNASLSNHFQIFVALAILEQQRDVIVKYLHHFDEVLQYMNGLSGQIDVDRTLAEAQVLCLSLKQLINQQEKVSQQSQSKNGKGDEAATLAAAAIAPVDDEIKALVGIHTSSAEKEVIPLS